MFLTYEAAALKRWRAAYDPWVRSDCTDYSVWGEYAALAESGRFLMPFAGESPSRRFSELHAALSLQHRGFESWGCVQLFHGEREVINGKGPTVKNTTFVRDNATWRWPSEIQESLDFGFPLRNPDLVAYSARRKWRFCEVKRDESVDPGQVEALAVLHLLTGAPVAIVRVTPALNQPDPTLLPVEIAYTKGARLNWIKRGLARP